MTTAKGKESWVDVPASCDFSLSNIPFGICSFPPQDDRPRCCSAIGSMALDLSLLAEAGLLADIEGLSNPMKIFRQESLNTFMSMPKAVWCAVRQRIIELLTKKGGEEEEDMDERLSSNAPLRAAALRPLSTARMHLPAKIGDYTDFYSSKEHAMNVGTLFRSKEHALQPNWLHLPVAYHGRASTVQISGTPVRRPCGQLQKDAKDPTQGSIFGPSRLLDFELEVAFFVGGAPASNSHVGQRITMSNANDRIFGFVLMNDWSARDVQKWEYVPLGPFGSKNFATTISPWVVTTAALEDNGFACMTSNGPVQENPKPLPYLHDDNYGSFDVHLTVKIQSASSSQPELVCQSNFRNLYWNAKQQLVHHAVTGCIMNPGDLLGSGTISGQEISSFGSMLELSWKGSRQVNLGDSGESRTFLKDGDTVILEGWAGDNEKKARVGFGVCQGTLLPALNDDASATVPPSLPSSSSSLRFNNFRLYGYWISSSTWRVRIALAAKGIRYTEVPINLLAKENKDPDYQKKTNAMSQVPVLSCMDSATGKIIHLTQSLSIIDFLEEALDDIGSTLMPVDIRERAFVREIAQIVNSGIQPLQNMALAQQITEESKGTMDGKEFGLKAIRRGLLAIEQLVSSFITEQKDVASRGPFMIGSFAPTLADVCIVPQLYNGRRFGVDVDAICPSLLSAEKACLEHEWFQTSHPDCQSDNPAKQQQQS